MLRLCEFAKELAAINSTFAKWHQRPGGTGQQPASID
jgi:hypothetical protein